MALSRLQDVSSRLARRIVGCARESVGSCTIREIVEATTADIRNVDTKTELMFTIRVCGEFGSVEMIFGSARVSLGASGSEQSGDCNLRRRIDARYGVVEVSHQE